MDGQIYFDRDGLGEPEPPLVKNDRAAVAKAACKHALANKIAAGGNSLLDTALALAAAKDSPYAYNGGASEMFRRLLSEPEELLAGSEHPDAGLHFLGLLARDDRESGKYGDVLLPWALANARSLELDIRQIATGVFQRSSTEDLTAHADAVLGLMVSSLEGVTWNDELNIRTLARVAHPDLDAVLRRGLEAPNWRVNLAVMDAIQLQGRAAEFRTQLERIAEDHYSHGIRAAASRIVDGGSPDTGYFNYQGQHGPDQCRAERICTGSERGEPDSGACHLPATFFLAFEDKIERRQLVRTVGKAPEDFPPQCAEGAAIPVDLPGEASALYPIEGGWLAAVNQGQWGGGLFFVPPEGTAQILRRGNVHSIVPTDLGLLVFAGDKGTALNQGRVYRIQVADDGAPRADTFAELPSGFIGHWLDPDGKVYVATFDGVVHLGVGGEIAFIDCAGQTPSD
jgi:hypothetical protein